ncbi:MAG: cob(I)yrinic acid a,c-diamide adenosyltransferase [Oscillospiraceae bacterium]|jgi:cob(I)alamin adenosyltransferase
MRLEKGFVHIYYGDGKGKTTAALGAAIRVSGAEIPVLFVQFLKSRPTSELDALDKAEGITVLRSRGSGKFLADMTPSEKQQEKSRQENLFNTAVDYTAGGRFGMVVLDELLDAVAEDMVGEGEVCRFLEERPSDIEVVITGHKPVQSIIRYGDYITEMKCISHPYDRGVSARKGIEY